MSAGLLSMLFVVTWTGMILVLKELHNMSVDLTAAFAKLDASIAALPARIAAAEAAAAANQIQAADVQAAADARAVQVDAIAPAA